MRTGAIVQGPGWLACGGARAADRSRGRRGREHVPRPLRRTPRPHPAGRDPAPAVRGVGGSFGQVAYRLSPLALVGDGQSEALAGPVAELARVPLAPTLSDARRPIGRDEVAGLSAGMLAPSAGEGRISDGSGKLGRQPRPLLGNTCRHRFLVSLPLFHSCYKALPLFGSIRHRLATAFVEKPLSSRAGYLKLVGFHIRRFLA